MEKQTCSGCIQSSASHKILIRTKYPPIKCRKGCVIPNNNNLRGFEHEHEYELLSTKYLKAKTRKGCRTF